MQAEYSRLINTLLGNVFKVNIAKRYFTMLESTKCSLKQKNFILV